MYLQAAKDKKKPETTEVPAKKQRRGTEESVDNVIVDVDKQDCSKMKSEAGTSSNREHDDAKEDEGIHDNKDPIPSTSKLNEKEPSTRIKKYKKSLPYIQYNWCKQQSAFLTLRDNLANEHK